MKSEACNRPYAFYEGFVIDRLIERGACSPAFLEVHAGRIKANYDLGFAPEIAVNLMCEIWTAGKEIGAVWATPEIAKPKAETKAIQDTMRFLDSMKRKGIRT